MKQNKYVPAIRFKGFYNDFQINKLNFICDVYDGIHHTPRYTKDGIKFLSVENIKDLKSNKYISIEDFNNDYKVYPENGDILMTRIGDVGTANIVNTNELLAYYVSLALLKNSKLDSRYLLYNIASTNFQREVFLRTLHIAFPKKINKNEIEKINVIYTENIAEQTQIGNFFKTLDEQINLQEQKHQKLVNLKKAMLEKMFPKEGADVPEIRFNGFTEKWEEKKLGDFIIGVIGGVSITPSDYTNEGIRTIPKGAINEFGVANLNDCKYVSHNYADKFKNNQVKTYDVVTSLRDLVPTAPNLGRVVKILDKEERFLMPQGVYKLILNKSINESFLIILSNTDSFREIIFANKSGSTQVHMRNQEYLNLIQKFPLLEEQQKIGEYFEKLDTLIQQSQVQIEKYKNIKQALLQKMFV